VVEGRGPRRRIEQIELEIGGRVYRGERSVTGEHELKQQVRFEALREQDPNDYERDDEDLMRDVAKKILRELVERSQGQGRRSPVKVEPREKPQRERGDT
jgi:hypothetical protein